MFLALALTRAAFADAMTLDNGTVVTGDLAIYQFDGSCQISVHEGEVAGAILIVPCARIVRFERVPVAAPSTRVQGVLIDEGVTAESSLLPPPEGETAGVPLGEGIVAEPALLPETASSTPSPESRAAAADSSATPPASSHDDDWPASRTYPSMAPRRAAAPDDDAPYEIHHAPEEAGTFGM